MTHRPHHFAAPLLGVVAAALMGVAPAAGQETSGGAQDSQPNGSAYQDSQSEDQSQRAGEDWNANENDNPAQNENNQAQNQEQQRQDPQQGAEQQDAAAEQQSTQQQEAQQQTSDSQWQEDAQRDQQQAAGQSPAGLGVLLSRSPQQDGAQVIRVYPNSPAQQAGVRAGDWIMAINNQQIRSAQRVADQIRRMSPGEQVELRVRRDGQTQSLTTQLAQRSDALRRGEQSRRRVGYRGTDMQTAQGDMRARLDELSRRAQQLSNEISALRAQLGAQRGGADARSERSGAQQGFAPAAPANVGGQPGAYNEPSFEGDGSEDVSRAAGNTGRDLLRSRTNRVDD